MPKEVIRTCQHAKETISTSQPMRNITLQGSASVAKTEGAKAIGDDKPNIERIYKDGFLDMTDLNQLPISLRFMHRPMSLRMATVFIPILVFY